MRSFNRDKLRKLRLSNGYSLEMMARALAMKSGKRITKSAISHWELGKTTPSLGSLLAMSELFLVPVDYFFEPQTNYLLERLLALHVDNKHEPLPKHD